MSVVKIIDDVTEWAQANICDRVKLKAPPEDDTAAVDEGYEYTLVTPSAFPLYVPARDKLPPSIVSPIPSLCVRFISGEDNLSASNGAITMQLCFSSWDVGKHGADMFLPQKDSTFKRWTGEEADAYFKRSADGWRDAWNFVDVALREIENRITIAGLEIDRSTPVRYGPLAEQQEIPDFYPFWYSWIEFSLKYPLIRNIEDFQKYL